MATEIKLPELGDGIESGDILEIFVSVGDTVSEGDDIVEVETDKASVPVPSTVTGTVASINVESGQTIAIGDVLITVDGGAAAPEAPVTPAVEAEPAPAPPEPEVQPEPVAATPEPEPEPAPVIETPAPAPAPVVETPAPVAATPTPAPVVQPTSADSGDIAAGPAIRRFAREVGVDLANVTGSGVGGRITREDILEVVRQANQQVTAPATTQAASSTSAPTSKAPGEPGTDAFGPVHVEAMPKIRKTIAAKMHESWSSAPRVTNFDDADVTDLEMIRRSSKQDYLDQGIKLTSMPFIIKSVALALRNNPKLNAALDMDAGQVIYKDYVNVGIAVDSDRGLVVPSLRSADSKSISDIARDLGTLAQSVRSNNFGLDDLRGSTFTISNLGAIGGTYSTPIINVPEVAILLVGRTRKLPVVIDDEIEIRQMMPLSLSYDHRIVDGGDAARFLNEVIGYLQAPSRLLLAP